MKTNYIITLEISSELEAERLRKNIIDNNYKNNLAFESVILLTEENFYNNDNPQKCPPYQSTLRHHAKTLLKGDDKDGIEVFRIKH